jgi:polyhydroxybutyrate depolymerase
MISLRSLWLAGAAVGLIVGCGSTSSLTATDPLSAPISTSSEPLTDESGESFDSDLLPDSRFDTRNATPKPLRGSLISNGLTRTYLTYTPTSYNAAQPAPLLIALHGRLSLGVAMMNVTGFNTIAETEGFIAAYPDGIKLTWNDGRTTSGINSTADDVRFIRDLIDEISKTRAIDPNRIYVVGMSNGGFMANRLACDLSDRIAAFAAVSGTLATVLQSQCQAAPRPALLMHGSADRIVRYSGTSYTLSAPTMQEQWWIRNGCSSAPSVTLLPDLDPSDGTRVESSHSSNCLGGSAVTLLTIQEGGHTWPGGLNQSSTLGLTSQDINASQVIWDFLKTHRL